MPRDLSKIQYRDLAGFRYQICRFLHFSESEALKEGLEPRQHQVLLAIKAMPESEACTVGALASRLFLRHQSMVGLIDRLELMGMVGRSPSPDDRRQVIVSLTKKSGAALRRLSLVHTAELKQSAPELARALRAIIQRPHSAK